MSSYMSLDWLVNGVWLVEYSEIWHTGEEENSTWVGHSSTPKRQQSNHDCSVLFSFWLKRCLSFLANSGMQPNTTHNPIFFRFVKTHHSLCIYTLMVDGVCRVYVCIVSSYMLCIYKQLIISYLY